MLVDHAAEECSAARSLAGGNWYGRGVCRGEWRELSSGLMWAMVVVVLGVGVEDLSGVVFIPDQQVVEDLVAQGSDHPFAVGVARCRTCCCGAGGARCRSAGSHDLAGQGHLDTAGQPPLFSVFTQFLCGYRDIDLRDATGLGHGQLIAHHGSARTRQHWIPRLLAGELAGIAVTESTAAPARPRPARPPRPVRTAPGWSPAARPGSPVLRGPPV